MPSNEEKSRSDTLTTAVADNLNKHLAERERAIEMERQAAEDNYNENKQKQEETKDTKLMTKKRKNAERGLTSVMFVIII